MGVVGGAYSGMVRMSNCEMSEIVMLRYVGIVMIGLLYVIVLGIVVVQRCC